MHIGLKKKKKGFLEKLQSIFYSIYLPLDFFSPELRTAKDTWQTGAGAVYPVNVLIIAKQAGDIQ